MLRKKPGKGRPEVPKSPRRETGSVTRATRMASNLELFVSGEWHRLMEEARAEGRMAPEVEMLAGRHFSKYMRFLEEGLSGKTHAERLESAAGRAKLVQPERLMLANALGRERIERFDRNRVAEKMALTFLIPKEHKEEFKWAVENYLEGAMRFAAGETDLGKVKFVPGKHQLMRMANEWHLGGRKIFAFEDLEAKLKEELTALLGRFNLPGLEKRSIKRARPPAAFPHSESVLKLKMRSVDEALQPFKKASDRSLIGDVLSDYFDAVSKKDFQDLPRLEKALDKLGFALFRQQFVGKLLPELYAIKKLGADYHYYTGHEFQRMEWLVDQASGGIETQRDLADIYRHYLQEVKAGKGLSHALKERMADFKVSERDTITKDFLKTARKLKALPAKVKRERLFSLPDSLHEIQELIVSKEALSKKHALKPGFTRPRLKVALMNFVRSVSRLKPEAIEKCAVVLEEMGVKAEELKRVARETALETLSARLLNKNLAQYQTQLAGKQIDPSKPDLPGQVQRLREKILKALNIYYEKVHVQHQLNAPYADPLLSRQLVRLSIDTREVDRVLRLAKVVK